MTTTTTPIRWKELSARERDALVATELFGFKCNDDSNPAFDWTDPRLQPPGAWWTQDGVEWCCELPPYSQSVEQAFQVVEKMREKGFEVVINAPSSGFSADYWSVTLAQADGHGAFNAYAPTLPEACCLAALTAIGLTIERE